MDVDLQSLPNTGDLIWSFAEARQFIGLYQQQRANIACGPILRCGDVNHARGIFIECLSRMLSTPIV
jgi:hypothetical protein